MVGILIIAHGTLGEALIHCASHVLGKRPQHVRQVGITLHDDPDAMLRQAQELARQLDQGSGVLVLTDMLGATPSNIAARLMTPEKVDVVSGVSLPMLLRALTYRNQSLATVVAKAMSGGHEGVVHLGATEAHAATRN
jgi:PTS system mannose-specific IIA component